MELISKNLATLIRDLRLSTGISQRDLARGICSQSEISHIENGKIIPCVYTLISISEKLGVNPVYFIERINKVQYDLVHTVKSDIQKCSHDKDYVKMKGIIKKYEKHTCFQPIEEKQFLLWHKGIMEYYVNNNSDLSLHYLDSALCLKQSFYKTNQDINILNSSAIIYSENEEYQKSIELFEDAIKIFEQSDTISDFKLYIKLLYNLSKSHTNIGNYSLAIKYCDLGIRKCKKEYTNFLYGELYYQKAYINKLNENFLEAEALFNKSLFLFSEYSKQAYIKATLEQIEEIVHLKKNLIAFEYKQEHKTI